MKSYPYLIACPHCGGVYRLRPLVGNDVAQCGRCLAILYRSSSMDPARLLPLAFASAITFLMANAWPVMTVSFHGLTHNVTLWQSMWSLAQGDTVLLAWCAVLFLILAPSLQIMLLTWILLFASARRRAGLYRHHENAEVVTPLEHDRSGSARFFGRGGETVRSAGCLCRARRVVSGGFIDTGFYHYPSG